MATASTGAAKRRNLFQFVREYLCRKGGSANRSELLEAMLEQPRIRGRLEGSQGFDRVLANMRYSGWVELNGDAVNATPKTRRRTLV